MERVKVYIEQMDRTGIYSNFGPLYCQYIERVAGYFGVSRKKVMGISSGTSGLMGCLLVYKQRTGRPANEITVAVPDWTFSATLQAPLSLGMRVVLVDVGPQGYMTPENIKELDIDVAIVVAPFGDTTCVDAWKHVDKRDTFVIVDGAAAFFTASEFDRPCVISTHCTKGFSTGEGGLVICNDEDYISELVAVSSFGFRKTREAEVCGLNLKMSEISCAYGNASLDMLKTNKESLDNQVQMYSSLVGEKNYIKPFQPDFTRTTYNVRFREGAGIDIRDLVAHMASDYGIEVRKWWAGPMHTQRVSTHPDIEIEGEMVSSLHLDKTVVGIPMGPHVSKMDQEYIIKAFESYASGLE